jgi:hypothetical protein
LFYVVGYRERRRGCMFDEVREKEGDKFKQIKYA